MKGNEIGWGIRHHGTQLAETLQQRYGGFIGSLEFLALVLSGLTVGNSNAGLSIWRRVGLGLHAPCGEGSRA